MSTRDGGISVKLMFVVVGIISGFIGASVNHYFSRTEYLEKKVLDFREKAYTEFFQGHSLYWSTPENNAKANELIRSAKLKILLISSPEVIKSMAEYWIESENHEECINVKEKKKDVAIYMAMRSEFHRSLELTSKEIPDDVLVPYLRRCTIKH